MVIQEVGCEGMGWVELIPDHVAKQRVSLGPGLILWYVLSKEKRT